LAYQQHVLSYLFVVSGPPRLFGQTIALRALYLHADGTFEASDETSDDEVIAARFSTVDPAPIFSLVEALANLSPPSPTREAVPNRISDGVAGSTRLDAVWADGPTFTWVGPDADAPAEVKSVHDALEALSASLDDSAMQREPFFARSVTLGPGIAADFEHDGRLNVIAPELVAGCAPLTEVVTHPERLVPLASDQSLYCSLPLAFRLGQSVVLRADASAVQIRHLVARQP
jgi:hypothetical protein